MAGSPSIARLRELHELAKQGALSIEGRTLYDVMRTDFARAMVRASHVEIRPGQTPPMAMRVQQALKVRIALPLGGTHTTITADLAGAGFSTLVPERLAVGSTCPFELHLGRDPVAGVGTVLDVQPQSGVYRVWFSLDGLTPALRERVESFVLEAALRALP